MTGDSVIARRPLLLVVDSRPPDVYPLKGILECAASSHDVHLVAEGERAFATVAELSPCAAFIHAGVDYRVGMPRPGPLVAALCRRYHPDLPLLLYTGDPSAGTEGALAQLGVPCPVVFDRRLAESFDSIVRDLVEHTSIISAHRRLSGPRPLAHHERLPERFRIERFLEQAKRSLLRAAIREHPDRTKAAAMVNIPLETFEDHLGQYDLEVPRERRPQSSRGESILWCSDGPSPAGVTEACAALDLGVRCVLPGSLHPDSVLSPATVAAIVDPVDAASAVDAWVAHRCPRPCLLFRAPPVPVRFLLEELLQPAGIDGTDGCVPALLLRVGVCAAHLYRDERPGLRIPFRPDGLAAWPLDVPTLCRTVGGRLLWFARHTTRSLDAAADAVGLPERTFRRRLKAAGGAPSGARACLPPADRPLSTVNNGRARAGRSE